MPAKNTGVYRSISMLRTDTAAFTSELHTTGVVMKENVPHAAATLLSRAATADKP
jgi:hypothetical protein